MQRLLLAEFAPLPTPAGTNCLVVIRIDLENGRVAAHELRASSGIAEFDAAALRVVATATLPPPPARYQALFAERGIGIRFVPP